MSVAAVILAAGEGRRFNDLCTGGEPGSKLLAPVKGRALVHWAIAPAIEAGFDEVVVVEGAADLSEVVGAGVTLVVNREWPSGQASSLHVGLSWCRDQGHEQAVIGLGDLPGLTVVAWRAVRDASGGPIVFALYGGRRGHPVRLSLELLDLLPANGDEGARSLARAHPEWVSDVECTGEPDDIDVPADLERWS
jgi:nicotine blue oxidoreductase